MTRARRSLVLLPLLMAFFLATPARADRAPENFVTRAADLIKSADAKSKRVRDTVWVIDYSGKSIGDFKLVLAMNSAEDDILVVFVTVAKKANIPLTPELMAKLLRMNHAYDYVKVGLDDDGDLFVRGDAHVRTLDVGALKDLVKQVAAAANETHAAIKADLR